MAERRPWCGYCGWSAHTEDCPSVEIARLRAALAEAERDRDNLHVAVGDWKTMHERRTIERDALRTALRAVVEACEAVSVDPGCWCEPDGRAGMHPEPHSDRCNQTGRDIAAARRLVERA